MPSVAYLWSPQLQRAADGLPANTGRSSLVHGLIRSLGLLEETATVGGGGEGHGEGDDEDGGNDGDEQTRNQPKGKADGQRAASARDDTPDEEAEPEPEGADSGPLSVIRGVRVVAPDPSLGTQAELRRYHDQRYIGEPPAC